MKKSLIYVVILSLFIVSTYMGYNLIQSEQNNQVMNEDILTTNIQPQIVTIDMKKQTGKISPLLFGGAHTPLPYHLDAWDKSAESGITLIRRDFFMEQTVPTDITLNDYRINKNEIQNPSKWNQDLLNAAGVRFKLAKERGIKTMGVIDYVPSWLTYSGTSNGVPKDWAVFRDIVKKHYLLYRDDLDYIEAWNEPTYERFNDIANSGLTMEQSYVLIAKNIIEVVRETDKEINDGKRMNIGGLVADNPDRTAMLRAILEDEYLRSEIDFISYHTYDHPEPSHIKYKTILKEFNMENIPIFITEWNYDAKETEINPYKSGNPAIIYTADKLLTMMENGISGANYYMLEPIDFDSPGIGKKYMGYYKWENNKATLLPQSRTWMLMSKSLGLGKDTNIMVNVDNSTKLRIVGFINSDNQYGALILNKSNQPIVISTSFINTGKSDVKNFQMYYASGEYDGSSVVKEIVLPSTGSKYSKSILIPENTLVGIKLTDDVSLYNKIRYLIK